MKFVPKEFMDEYDLHNKIHEIHIYNKIQGGLYVLPQSDKLTNNLLKNGWHHLDTLNADIHLDYRNNHFKQSISHLLLTSLVSNMLEKST